MSGSALPSRQAWFRFERNGAAALGAVDPRGGEPRFFDLGPLDVVALLHAGAKRVVATDLEANTRLLRANVSRNAPDGKVEGTDWDVKALSWGADASEALDHEPFDLVVSTDCMYVVESAGLLADTLEALVGESARLKKKSRAPFGAPVLFSYGRNRQAESAFESECVRADRAVTFTPSDVPDEELDELYQCSDVRVVRYRAEARA